MIKKIVLYLVFVCILLLAFHGIGFTTYFVVCALCLLAYLVTLRNEQPGREKKIAFLIYSLCSRHTLIWTVVTVCSFLVTMNYLHPNMEVYTNADYHVLSLEGVDVETEEMTLVGKSKKQCFFDATDIEGDILLEQDDGQGVIAARTYSLPIFVHDTDGVTCQRNDALPVLNESLSISSGDTTLTVRLVHHEKEATSRIEKLEAKLKTILKKDSGNDYDFCSYIVTIEQGGTLRMVDTCNYKKVIKKGYNLGSILRSDVEYEVGSVDYENLVAMLDGVDLIRVKKDSVHLPFQITIPKRILSDKSVVLAVDGSPVDLSVSPYCSISLTACSFFSIGLGEEETRPMRCDCDGQTIHLSYQMPVMHNFPHADSSVVCRKRVAIASDKLMLMDAEASEAFLYDLFHESDNIYGFDGNITYVLGDSRTPLDYTIFTSGDNEYTSKGNASIKSVNGMSKWHLGVYNMREYNPITHSPNKRVTDVSIIRFVLLLCFIAYLIPTSYQLFRPWIKNKTNAPVLTGIWLFVIPLFVLRLYLMWRTAVFPPLDHITKGVFLQYTLSNGFGDNNAMIMTWLSIGLLAMLSLVFILVNVFRRKPTMVLCRFKGWVTDKGWRFVVTILPLLIVEIVVAWVGGRVLNLNPCRIPVPVIGFILIDGLILMCAKSGWWRSVNGLVSLGLLFVLDPGYSIMFFLFQMVYFSVSLLAYKRSHNSVKGAMANWLSILFFVVFFIVLVGFRKITPLIFNDTKVVFGLTKSSISFFIIGIVVTIIFTLFANRFLGKQARVPVWVTTIIIGVALSSGLAVMAPKILQDKPHLVYRALVQTKSVDEIMETREFGDVDHEYLLRSAENQWFLQYYSERGKGRIWENGIVSLAPHMQQCVTWPTQISDVVTSRFVIGELSALVPLSIILLTVILVFFVFSIPNGSGAAKSITIASVLLILLQMLFVWMTVTNRMLFFGQDFPFLSLTARGTMIMFVLLLALVVIFADSQYIGMEDEKLADGYASLAHINIRPGTKALQPILTWSAFLIAIVVLWNNNYKRLYTNNDPDKFNLYYMMERAETELNLINHRMRSVEIRQDIHNGQDVTDIMNKYDKEVGLSEYVDSLLADGRICKFTHSLYRAFVDKQGKHNTMNNIIHLRHIANEDYCMLALNNGFYSLRNPESTVTSWRGDIYSADGNDVQSKIDRPKLIGKTGFKLVHVPDAWMPDGRRCDLVDCRNNYLHSKLKITVHRPDGDYTITSTLVPIFAKDFLEIHDGSTLMATVAMQRRMSNIVVKNMQINGRPQGLYAMGDRLFWLKPFYELMSQDMDVHKKDFGVDQDVFITIDRALTEAVTSTLRQKGTTCSVVAMDGTGAVRLMAECKPAQYILDPNDDHKTLKRVEASYLNPTSEDQNVFGNMNLVYMRPGPGSTLKPITYAAVTSECQDFPWESLKMYSPSLGIYDTSVVKKGGHYRIRRFGPEYRYSFNGKKSRFQSIASDEAGDKGKVDNTFYLVHSSNYYNALITYLGNLSKDKLTNINSIFAPAGNDRKSFPVVDVGEKTKMILCVTPDPLRETSPLYNGLLYNFKMPTNYSAKDPVTASFIGTEEYANNYSWAYPQKSSIYNFDFRHDNISESSRLKQYTLGSYPVTVTPLKMATMYGMLFSMDAGYSPHVKEGDVHERKAWQNDGRGEKGMLDFLKKNIYVPMGKCVTEGTGSSFISKDTREAAQKKGLELFCKTGTLALENERDNHMLAVVITNGKSVDALDYRFYVVYFRYKEIIVEDMAHNEVLQAIMNSTTFNNYMKGGI